MRLTVDREARLRKKMVKKTTTAKKAAFEAPMDKRFWLNSGKVIAGLSDLGAVLEKMEDSIWKFHVTKDKNDFANWIEDVFQEKKLGLAIRKAKTAKAAAKLIKSKTESAKLWTFF